MNSPHSHALILVLVLGNRPESVNSTSRIACVCKMDGGDRPYSAFHELVVYDLTQCISLSSMAKVRDGALANTDINTVVFDQY